MGIVITFIAMFGVWLSGVAVVLTFFAGFAVWLSTFLTTPLFENAEVLYGDLFTMTGWALLSWVVCFVLAIVSGAFTASRW